MSITRRTHNITRTIASAAALTDAMDVRDFVAGTVKVPSAWTAAGLGFQVSDTVGGTYDPLYTHDDALVEIAALTVSRQYELPPEIFACGFIKGWSQTSASGVNQDAERTLVFTFKS